MIKKIIATILLLLMNCCFLLSCKNNVDDPDNLKKALINLYSFKDNYAYKEVIHNFEWKFRYVKIYNGNVYIQSDTCSSNDLTIKEKVFADYSDFTDVEYDIFKKIDEFKYIKYRKTRLPMLFEEGYNKSSYSEFPEANSGQAQEFFYSFSIFRAEDFTYNEEGFWELKKEKKNNEYGQMLLSYFHRDTFHSDVNLSSVKITVIDKSVSEIHFLYSLTSDPTNNENTIQFYSTNYSFDVDNLTIGFTPAD